MLDLNLVREQYGLVAEGLGKRGQAEALLPVRDLDARRRALLVEVEGLKKAADEPFDLGVFNHAGRENAPAPKAEATVPASETSPAAPPAEQPKAEKPAFAWDFAAFKSALTEGVK